MNLWIFLFVHQVKSGQWMTLLVLVWPAIGFIFGFPVLSWAPHIPLVIGCLILGCLLDKPFYERQMPALWKYLPATDAELDRIITSYEMRLMNEDIGEPYWPLQERR